MIKDFEEIQKLVGTNVKPVDIHGKGYALVNDRVKIFRKLCPNGAITSEILSLENSMVVIRATIKDDEGKVLATGIAYEKEGTSNINKTSYIENCETSAVGRALAFVGIGIDAGIAAAEEVNNAIEIQNKKYATKQQRENINALLNANKDLLEVYKKYVADNNIEKDANNVPKFSQGEAEELIKKLEGK